MKSLYILDALVSFHSVYANSHHVSFDFEYTIQCCLTVAYTVLGESGPYWNFGSSQGFIIISR